MLKKINAGKVESDEGFDIQITGPETLKYRRGQFEIDFDMGYDRPNRKIYIYISSILSQERHVGINEMDKEMKNKIFKDISNAVRLLEGNFEIV